MCDVTTMPSTPLPIEARNIKEDRVYFECIIETYRISLPGSSREWVEGRGGGHSLIIHVYSSLKFILIILQALLKHIFHFFQ